MSYILEALKKSEQERKLGSVPQLSSQREGSATTTPASTRAWLVPVLLINSLLLIALLGYMVLRSPEFDSWPQQVSEEAAAPVPGASGKNRETESPASAMGKTSEPPAGLQNTPAFPVSAPLESPADEHLSLQTASPAAQPSPSGPVPKLSEMPIHLREQIVLPKLEVHAYHDRRPPVQ